MDGIKTDELTVEQAVERLSAIAGRSVSGRALKLVIPYEPGQVMIGATPAVPVVDFSAGIDWNHGKVLVHPAHRIRGPIVDLEKEQQLVRRAINAIGAIAMHMRSERTNPDDKLRLISETIARFNSKTDADPAAEQLAE